MMLLWLKRQSPRKLQMIAKLSPSLSNDKKIYFLKKNTSLLSWRAGRWNRRTDINAIFRKISWVNADQ